ncbi:MAG: oligosaccharide flippase family protein [bacterium]
MFREISQFILKVKQKYFSSGVILFLPQIVSLGISMITLPIILSNLSIDDYGRYQFVLAIETWVLALTGSYITNGVKSAIANGFKGTFFYAFFYRLRLAAIVMLFGFVVIIIFFLQQSSLIAILLCIVFIYAIFGQIVNTSFINYLISTKRFKEKAAWEISIGLIVNLTALASAYYTHNIIIFVISSFGSLVLLSWIGFIYVSKKDHLLSEFKKNNIDKKCVSFGLKMIPANIINITSTKISSIIIGLFLGYTTLSTFSVADNLRNKFAMVVRIIDPLLYADFAKQKKGDLVQSIKSKLKIFFLISIIFTLIVLAIGYGYISLFFPTDYQITKIYFMILALTFPFSAVSYIFDVLFQSHLLHRETSIESISVDILKILLILLFGYLWGILGICVAITLSSWMAFFIYYLLIFKPQVLPSFLKR